MRWVTANALETWAQTVNAEVELPKVVSDLIRASVPDIATMRFPSGDKGRVRGFDGHLISGSEGFNVPRGVSYWEFGTDKNYRAKANREFEKRTKQVSPADQAESTFVFVSPWTWDSSKPQNKLENWESAWKKASSWKDVRYLDGSALEIWLDQCPAVAAWHARETFGVRPARWSEEHRGILAPLCWSVWSGADRGGRIVRSRSCSPTASGGFDATVEHGSTGCGLAR